MNYTYIVECGDGSLYTGWTNNLEKRIQELKKQSHMLRKVLADGNIGSAVFIEQRNQMDMELEKACHRQQLLKEQKVFEQEIAQTEYLLTVFRNRPVIIEEFDEELFLIIIQQVTVYPAQRLGFRLKNGRNLWKGSGVECRIIRQWVIGL